MISGKRNSAFRQLRRISDKSLRHSLLHRQFANLKSKNKTTSWCYLCTTQTSRQKAGTWLPEWVMFSEGISREGETSKQSRATTTNIDLAKPKSGTSDFITIISKKFLFFLYWFPWTSKLFMLHNTRVAIRFRAKKPSPQTILNFALVWLCTVTWLPNFLRWVVKHFFLPMVFRYKTTQKYIFQKKKEKNNSLVKTGHTWTFSLDEIKPCFCVPFFGDLFGGNG